MEQALRTELAPFDIRRAHPAPALELVVDPSPAVKARQLFEEAKAASFEHLRLLDAGLQTVGGQLEAIVEGGDLYAPGLREFARKLAEDLAYKTKTLRMLSQRQA